MSTTSTTTLGACPECGATIAQHDLLIAYERSDGPAMFAECPDCGAVVHPA